MYLGRFFQFLIIAPFAFAAALCLCLLPGAQAKGFNDYGRTLSQSDRGILLVKAIKHSRQDLARIAYARKRVTEARKEFGKDHENYAQALFNLAQVYRTVGESKRAEGMYKTAIAIWTETLGPDHPKTKQAKSMLQLLTWGKNGGKSGGKKGKKKSFGYKIGPSSPSSGVSRKRAYRRATPARPAPRSMKRRMAPPPPNATMRSLEAAREPAAAAVDRESASSADDTQEAPFTTVRVFYATDRNKTGSTKPGEAYGVERSGIQYGICDVSIPRDHRMGELEAPSIWKLEFSENPERHVVLLKVLQQNANIFFGDMKRRVRKSAGKSAFLFVHGYNTTFEKAARRTAQMTYDLGFDGAPVFYSWPSQGTTAGYTIDENNNRWTETHLKTFVSDFVKKSGAKKVFLVAHSMGSRALTNAMTALVRDDPSIKNRIEAIILAAPDIDAEIFKRDILPRMNGVAKSITLYASSQDNALLASKQIHGYPRAGDAGEDIIVAEGLDTIDASNVDTSLLGHSYYAESKSIISDLFAIIHRGTAPGERENLKPVQSSLGNYWTFR